MKNFLFYSFLGFFLFIFAFTGCGSDNPATPNNNGGSSETLIWPKDSLAISGTGVQNVGFVDTVAILTDTSNYKLSFSSETNCDSIDTPSIFARVECNSFVTLDTTLYKNTLNNIHTFTFRVYSYVEQGLVLDFNSTQSRYLRIKNIRLVKVQ